MSGKLRCLLLEQTDAGVSQASAKGETMATHSATTAMRPVRMKSPALYLKGGAILPCPAFEFHREVTTTEATQDSLVGRRL